MATMGAASIFSSSFIMLTSFFSFYSAYQKNAPFSRMPWSDTGADHIETRPIYHHCSLAREDRISDAACQRRSWFSNTSLMSAS